MITVLTHGYGQENVYLQSSIYKFINLLDNLFTKFYVLVRFDLSTKFYLQMKFFLQMKFYLQTVA